MSFATNDNRRKITPNQDAFFLSEVSGFCPLCNDFLQYKKGNNRYKNYEIAHIYPCNPTERERHLLKDCPRLSINSEDEENKIALCLKCHNGFDNPRTREEYLKLYNIKLSIINKKSVRTMFNEFPVHEEIIQIINSLIDIQLYDSLPISLDSIKVKNKITDRLLCKKVTDYVAEYYAFIDNSFKCLNLSDKKYNLILCTFKHAYLKISEKAISQEEIFSNLVNWLSLKSGVINKTSNEIVISYFVQHCEVFNDIAQ